MKRLCIFLLFWLCLVPRAFALTPEEAVTRFFTAPKLEEAWFQDAFLAAVPLKQMQVLRDQLVAAHGPLQSVASKGDDYEVRLERAFFPAKITLDAEGRFAGLWFGAPIALKSLDETLAEIAALPGVASVLLRRDDEILADLKSTEALAVGSAFKLAVLKALKEEIEAGNRSWDDVVTLRAEARSLPTGFLQNWPVGAPITLHTLASLMISISDNTATDNLMALLGAQRVEEEIAPERRPLLTTVQYLTLGGSELKARRAAYLKADEVGKRAILEGLSGELPNFADFASAGTELEFGWRFSNGELCDLMDEVVGLDVLAIETAGWDKNEWQAVGYKGGAVIGAMNMTSGLIDKAGRHLCLSMTWNDPDGIKADRFQALYAQLMALTPRE